MTIAAHLLSTSSITDASPVLVGSLTTGKAVAVTDSFGIRACRLANNVLWKHTSMELSAAEAANTWI